ICLFYGARKGGIALGLLGGIGLVILVFVFHLQPGKPPVDVMLGIIASPVSVAVVSLVAMLGNFTFNGKHLEFLDLLSITIPSTL
ncbi:anaerobic C4-dicarboxylate transporter family protein, partial [Pseudocitrobacter faecalis]|uniref:anaerobic C4-dicarboxylate transporter family protein n=1 Tax=Pseudocitrobacter faecalis TaxID=1398493 RepID=UPI00331613B1